ncbi:MAG: YidC/Oxa1 family membrane protein insertase [Chloroflexi bacterium]|nr:YidC/Oxa1 family membrane protein insertase [Chloroflexota bacterium]
MTEVWNSLIVWPLTGALVALHGFLGSYGLAIIVLTLAIKFITFPLNLMQIRSSKAMRDVQPLMEEAKRRYGKDKERLTQETMRIYKEHGINPMAGCLPMLIQMPVWFGLYYALLHLAQTAPEFSQGFLWLPSLAHPDPFYILVILTVVTQFIVQRMMTMPSTDPQQQTMNKVMLFMPLTFGFVATSVPSGLALYWVTTNLFTFFQQGLTTGWGGILPGSKPSVAPARVVSADTDPAPGDGAAVNPQQKISKGARPKKGSGAKPPREEKRANGKR